MLEKLRELKDKIDGCLENHLERQMQSLNLSSSFTLKAFERFFSAKRHGLLGGGKGVRAFLVVESGNLFGANERNLIEAAAALEALHSYSLIHDDLPSMDNDDLRRGKPTVHKAYDEATAILAGDALLTLAFEILSAPDCHSDPNVRCLCISEMAKAAGSCGMVGGQILDLSAEGRFFSEKPIKNDILTIHALKTGALLRQAVRLGGIMGGATEDELKKLTAYGEAMGVLFQLTDDVLDATQETKNLGKTSGKDKAAGKATLPIEEAKYILEQQAKRAHASLLGINRKTEPLGSLISFILQRKY